MFPEQKENLSLQNQHVPRYTRNKKHIVFKLIINRKGVVGPTFYRLLHYYLVHNVLLKSQTCASYFLRAKAIVWSATFISFTRITITILICCFGIENTRFRESPKMHECAVIAHPMTHKDHFTTCGDLADDSWDYQRSIL